MWPVGHAWFSAPSIPEGPTWAVATLLVGGLLLAVVREFLKRRSHEGGENGAAERRTNAAVTKILEAVARSHELMRTDIANTRVALEDDFKATRHQMGNILAAPVGELGLELREVKEILIQIRERLPTRDR